MEFLDKWADRIYSETDVGRSIATSVAGSIGLIVYLVVGDWVIAVFASMIVFPIVRLLTSSRHERIEEASERHRRFARAETEFAALTGDEKALIEAFVDLGGCVMTWSQFNRSDLSSAAVESLIQRGLLSTSITADGMTETFALSVEMFDAASRHRNKSEGDA